MRPAFASAAAALAIAAAALPAPPAAAAELDPAWRVAAIGGDPFAPAVTVYFDVARLAAADGALAVRTLWAYAAPQAGGFRAMQADVRVRCAAASVATVGATFHATEDASGPAVGRFHPQALEWHTYPAQSLGALVLGSACAEAHRRGLG